MSLSQRVDPQHSAQTLGLGRCRRLTISETRVVAYHHDLYFVRQTAIFFLATRRRHRGHLEDESTLLEVRGSGHFFWEKAVLGFCFAAWRPMRCGATLTLDV